MSSSKSSTRTVDFGTPFRNRLSGSFQDWVPQLRANFSDIWQNPATQLIPEDNTVGVAVASGPSAAKNVELLKERDVVICCADRAAAAYGRLFRRFYVGTSDPSPLIAKFYETMPVPLAVVLSIFSHQLSVKVLKDRKIPHYYITPALKDDNDKEFKLLNKLLLDLTGAPLMYGISDSGSLAWRILVGLGCKKIALVGYDYGEALDTPFEKWSLYTAYRNYMESNNIKDVEKMRAMMNVMVRIHSTYGTKCITDRSWDNYRIRFLTMLEAGKRQGVETVNCTEGGSLDVDWLPCTSLEKFLGDFHNLGEVRVKETPR